MSNQTSNYNLIKPLVGEDYDVNVFNSNMDIIDKVLKENTNKTFKELTGKDLEQFLTIDPTYSSNVTSHTIKKPYICISNNTEISKYSIANSALIIYIPAQNTVYNVQLAFPLGSSRMFIRTSTGSGWGKWNEFTSSTAQKRTEIVVATYNTTSTAKDSADFIATSNDATTAINSAINAVGNGGTVRLLDGTYNLKGTLTINKSVKIVGAGYSTALNQGGYNNSECDNAIAIRARNVYLEDFMLCTYKCSSPNSLLEITADGSIIRNMFFVDNNTSDNVDLILFKFGDNYVEKDANKYHRIENNRIFRTVSSEAAAIACQGAFAGRIVNNISSGADGWIIRFINAEAYKNAVIEWNDGRIIGGA